MSTVQRFWERAIPHASERSQQRFIDTFDLYLEAVVAQAADRSNSKIRSIQDYLAVRRDTIGAKPSFALLEQGMDLPDEVFQHPAMQELHDTTIDMLCLGNVSRFLRVILERKYANEQQSNCRTLYPIIWNNLEGTILTIL